MIGFLRGRIVRKRPPQVVVEVGGIGYEVDAPMSTFYNLPAVGDDVRLLTHLSVREDAHTLYGFATDEERELFRSLIKVSGVGARLALTVLSGISVEDFTRCVLDEDASRLTQLPGIGKKTAARLIVEMRDRLDADAATGTSAPFSAGPVNARDEAQGALVALGYKPAEIRRMLDRVDGKDLTAEAMIRQALQATVR